MKFSILVIAALFACGWEIAPETAESRKADRAWEKEVTARYDLTALSTFLRKTVTELKTWEGTDLTKPKIGAKWERTRREIRSGDWQFWLSEPTKDEFVLAFLDGSGMDIFEVELNCRRIEKKRFTVLGITKKKFDLLLF